MTTKVDFKELREIFTALAMTLGVVIIQGGASDLIAALEKRKEKDLGEGLIRSALARLNAHREIVDTMCSVAGEQSVKVLMQYLAPKPS